MYKQDWIKSEDEFVGLSGNWFRHQVNLNRKFSIEGTEKSITPYLMFEQEDRRQRDQSNDSLNNQSLRFYELIPGIRYEAEKWLLDYSFGYRNDFKPLENNFRNESQAIQNSVQLNITPSNYFSTQNKITVRSKDIEQEFEGVGNTAKRSLLIRSNTSYATTSDNWEGNFLYEVNTQRQALLQETFIEVGPEIGQYVWDDLNNDGVEQLDEFFLELTPNEGTYLRQFLPSDDLFPVIDLKVRFRNEIKPFGRLGDAGNIPVF